MKRVLVANRGEIALRIIRACREETLEAVAVYSEADRDAPHSRAADQAVEIGPAPARESYLDIDRILEAAQRVQADAIHPGYGFLAERADFAERVVQAGMTFIGPPADAIRAMGNKTEARRRMEAAGIPVVPGTTEPLSDASAASRVAAEIGYPVLLKASAGGGGRGMRRVDSKEGLENAFQQASSEARSAFGDGAIYVERCLEAPRHVEIQVVADDHGTTVHVGERECSVQRRHQKLIEECPSTAVDAARRSTMGEAAVQAARSVGYRNVGTVEFLLGRDGKFYFLEMNTRLQVEHPVTELVYGVDLVREQLRIASGRPTSLADAPRSPHGHAIECRITAEDPFNDFLPSTGVVRSLRIPTGAGVRWDGGIEIGSDIGLFYDSLLGKLIVWAEDRALALRRMRRALDELLIAGVQTSQPFHRYVMDEPAFVNGSYDIEYLSRVGDGLIRSQSNAAELELVAVAAALAEHEDRMLRVPGVSQRSETTRSAWLSTARRDGLR